MNSRIISRIAVFLFLLSSQIWCGSCVGCVKGVQNGLTTEEQMMKSADILVKEAKLRQELLDKMLENIRSEQAKHAAHFNQIQDRLARPIAIN